ncbi:MAG: gamma-glutamyl-gamma-aminobutyrate hydrolase family protein [Clostridiales bacterium]|nr:gamma-glutamyl-gamma-aminobutyrate hydrolase family protein [Clostridiales bacterium]
MKKPLILLTGHWEPKLYGSQPFLGLYFSYFEAITRAGGIPLMLPYSAKGADLDDLLALGDGLVLTGGYDIDPALYNEPVRFVNVEVTKERDDHEVAVFERWSKTGKPILGICRGLQFLNVILGGSMYQDIPVERSVIHNNVEHKVKLVPGTRMREWLGLEEMVTNSYHHQGINRLAEGLVATGHSEDGIIEAIEHEQLPIFGFQFHPERMIADWRPAGQTDMSPAFDHFISLCKK